MRHALIVLGILLGAGIDFFGSLSAWMLVICVCTAMPGEYHAQVSIIEQARMPSALSKFGLSLLIAIFCAAASYIFNFGVAWFLAGELRAYERKMLAHRMGRMLSMTLFLVLMITAAFLVNIRDPHPLD